jgi:SAM-dependent methyltransferase
MKENILNTQTSYDQVAAEYAEKFKDEMDDKPFDRDCLDRLAREVGNLGPICDLGCGPGQIARYLHRQGVDTLGVDLSLRMLPAQRLNQASIFIRAIYSVCPMKIIPGQYSCFLLHHPFEEGVVDTLHEMKRVWACKLLLTFTLDRINMMDGGKTINLILRLSATDMKHD